MDPYPILKPLLFALPAEIAHHLALRAIALNILPAARIEKHPELAVEAFGLKFPNPIGLAAGFDKQAQAYNPLFSQGFGFVEVGTVTPLPQPGNPKPRLFRLEQDQAIINRFGFNSVGWEGMQKNLRRVGAPKGILGINIGKNKDTEDAVEDYVKLWALAAPHASYITINISSPNTTGLRSLQNRKALNQLLNALTDVREKTTDIPLLLKIAPDLDAAEKEDIAELCTGNKRVDGLIISNTTLSRPDYLQSPAHKEAGGLSGNPLFKLSTEALRDMYRLTQGAIPLIGAGGITSAQDAYIKIQAGATLVQLYSALIYQGFGLVREIHEGLLECLKRDGFTRISQAVGTRAE